MTVSATNVLSGPYAANGVTTAFPFTFAAAAQDEVAVLADGAALSSGLYSVALAGTGGTVTFAAAPADGTEILILSLPAFAQGLALHNNGAFLPQAIEAAFDRGVIRDLYLKARVDAVVPDEALLAEAGAGLYLARDAEGNPVFAAGTGADAGLRADLAGGGGAALIGYGDRTLEVKLGDLVNAADFGFDTANAGTANAAALSAAIALLDNDGGGTVKINAGNFALNTVHLASGLTLQGAGVDATTLTQGTTATSYGMLYAESGSPSTYVENITIRDMTLQNTVGTFSQFIHLAAFSGVRNLRFERVRFKGFRGDGICLHTRGVSNLTERHNVDVQIVDCAFDGVNHQNRQGVSIADCDGFKLVRCSFLSCTEATMPGAIDFEPEFSYSVIRNVIVRDNRFRDVGGNLGTLSFYFNPTVPLPTGIEVSGNVFEDYAGIGADIAIHVSRNVTAATMPMAVAVFGNWGRDGNIAMDLGSGKGIRAWGNCWQNYYFYGLSAGILYKLMDVSVADTFRHCGNSFIPYCAVLHTVDGFSFAGSRFIDCGNGTADSCAIYFVGTSVASYNVDLRGVSITTPEGRTILGILKTPGHAFDAASNRQRGIILSGLVNQFQSADQSGTATLTAGASGAIAAPGIAASTRVYVQRQTDGGTVGASYSVTRVAGTSVTFTSKDGAGATQTGDTSTISYQLEPA